MKPILRDNNAKMSFSLVIDQFPDGYENLSYIEPFGLSSVFLNKKRSQQEILHIPNMEIMDIYTSVRDDVTSFISEFKELKDNKKTFNYILSCDKKKATEHFYLSQFSYAGNKKKYHAMSKKDVNIIQQIFELSERLQGVFLSSEESSKIMYAFDEEATLCYCDIPENDNDWNVKVLDELNRFRGKVVVSCGSTPYYRKLYKEWNMVGKKNEDKAVLIYKNF